MKFQIFSSIFLAAGLSACNAVKPINPNPVFPLSDQHIEISKTDHRLKSDTVTCGAPADIWESRIQPSTYSQFVVSSFCAFQSDAEKRQERLAYSGERDRSFRVNVTAAHALVLRG